MSGHSTDWTHVTDSTADLDISEHPHRRLNLLTGEWLLVSPHRAKRPWRGDETPPLPRDLIPYDPECHLCPGNSRANGVRNPDYENTYVFANDFPALTAESRGPGGEDALFRAMPAAGEALVVCFSPDHSRTLPELEQHQVKRVVDIWCSEADRLGRSYSYVQVFENKGAMMGCSSPHPHGQIWASDFVPTQVAAEDARQAEWLSTRGSVLLAEVVEREERDEVRIVDRNAHWLAIVPWWAAWPFEILLIARDDVATLPGLAEEAREALASILRRITARYDRLFSTSFPYSMGWHQAPGTSDNPEAWRLHAHFYPPLLRSASVRKFMVGYEMLAEPQRDLTPEQAAERLRAIDPDL
ncbi:MAG TPA: UDP-glucose--hexose-1-phosphate uridylyltransferase [Allosphingosinicella sp.]